MLTGLHGIVRRVNDALAWAAMALGMAIVAFAVAALAASAIERHVTGMGYAWMNDLPPFLMPWCVFPLLGVLLRSGRHITVEVAPTLLHGGRLRALRLLVAAICVVTGVAFCIAGLEAVTFFQMMGEVTETEIEIPFWWLYAAFPAGFGLFALFALEMLLRELTQAPE
jgi:TRAP-type C4-dicarboxylate transport system permease small subunit